jgi:HEAT repeat protein
MGIRASFWISATTFGLLVVGCRDKADPLEKALRGARPELRKAVTAMCTPTVLLDNYGDELQVAWRLQILEGMNFKSSAKDRPVLKTLLTNEAASAYSRICAGFFLLDSDLGARSLLTNYLMSSNLRQRFNAARAVQWFAWRAQGEAREWATLELIKLLENRSLEIPSGTYTPSAGYETNGYDMMDDAWTPLRHVVYTLGDLKEHRAIPALKSLIERHSGDYCEAAFALGKIGDSSVAPFMLLRYGGDDSFSFGEALAMLKYRPAVPALVARLNLIQNAYEAESILRNLRDIGDPSALPGIERFVQSLSPEDRGEQKAAFRILAQMRSKDPVETILKMLDKETDEQERIELIRALGQYADYRSIDRLFTLAVSSDYTLFRGNAIGTLSQMGDQKALLTLVSILQTNPPPPINFDKLAILENRPLDYSRKHAAHALCETTHQDFGYDVEKWRRWITESR